MPRRAPTVCPHCGGTHPHGVRCPRLRDTRPSASRRGYGTDWRRLRAELMPEGTRCRMCGKPAAHLDHILPKSRGGTDDPSNLQPLCHKCHNRKTAAEREARTC
ncbi:HNH endonuclease [Roseospira goensis]|uniref:5-methylcytosine-specific restriction endonuclease McrA n=1 Tax=Roseospira goensis TaxID=391922 RepID=A0A7W6WM87_9PROT|nr:5-methylcytosine-specific restriction endonuclease McrA [Roseospira goensis]